MRWKEMVLAARRDAILPIYSKVHLEKDGTEGNQPM
jgi:hypothetical protein